MKRFWIKYTEVVALEELDNMKVRIHMKGGYSLDIDGEFEKVKESLMKLLEKDET